MAEINILGFKRTTERTTFESHVRDQGRIFAILEI